MNPPCYTETKNPLTPSNLFLSVPKGRLTGGEGRSLSVVLQHHSKGQQSTSLSCFREKLDLSVPQEPPAPPDPL